MKAIIGWLALIIVVTIFVVWNTDSGSSIVIEARPAGGMNPCSTAVILENGYQCFVNDCFVNKGDNISYLYARIQIPMGRMCTKIKD